ncbi:MAG TPA: hypothetical protein VK524_26695, partial [Polyangiaceae bacterium]|nr:hypothetical protein [Polyangiaceae bacterium]
MPETRDKADVLERLAERADLSDEERAVLREAAAQFRAPAPSAPSTPGPARLSRSARRARRSSPGPAAPGEQAGAAVQDIDAILWSDGAARGNPGPAGAGAVLKNPAGEVLA